MKTRFSTSLIQVAVMACLAGTAINGKAAIICDGIPVPVSLTASASSLPVLSSNTVQLIFKLQTVVGNDTHLGLSYTGTALNGYDVQQLPASVLIPALESSVALNIRPKPNYPFSSKTLTVTITNVDNLCVIVGSPFSATVTLTGFDPPRLALPKITSTGIELTWWAPVPGYLLESTSQLASGTWVTETNILTGTQGTNQVTLTPVGSAAFYRLVKP